MELTASQQHGSQLRLSPGDRSRFASERRTSRQVQKGIRMALRLWAASGAYAGDRLLWAPAPLAASGVGAAAGVVPAGCKEGSGPGTRTGAAAG